MESLSILIISLGIIGFTAVVLKFVTLMHKNRQQTQFIIEQTRYREAVNGTLHSVAQIAESDPVLAEKLSQILLSDTSTRPLKELFRSRFERPIPTRL
jgi:hypothetical protein